MAVLSVALDPGEASLTRTHADMPDASEAESRGREVVGEGIGMTCTQSLRLASVGPVAGEGGAAVRSWGGSKPKASGGVSKARLELVWEDVGVWFKDQEKLGVERWPRPGTAPGSWESAPGPRRDDRTGTVLNTSGASSRRSTKTPTGNRSSDAASRSLAWVNWGSIVAMAGQRCGASLGDPVAWCGLGVDWSEAGGEKDGEKIHRGLRLAGCR